MVVLSALPRTRDTDKESAAAADHRSNTRPSNRQGGRWSLRNLGLLGGIGPREHQSPHQQAEVLVAVDLPASHKQKQSTESNSSLETAATAATSSSSSSSSSSSAWASNTIQYEPSADDALSSSEHSSNMRQRPSTGKGTSSSSAGRPPSDDINGRRRPSIASDVIRAIAETASSVGIASSTATAAATEHKAKFTDDNSRSTTRASPQTMARRPPPSTAKEPTANVPRPVSSDNGKNVIHAQIRRRYSNPTLPDMLASSSHSSSGTGSTATSGGGNDTNANTFATSSSRPMPGRKASRRSSLKKVSSYGPAAEQQHRRASLRNFTGRRRMTPPLSSSTTTTMGGGGGLSGRRRHSMVDMTTAAALDTNSNDGDGTGSSVRDDRQSRRRSISLPTMYKEVTFDSSVSYATIPYVHDLCPRAPQRLFYADEDYARMKGDLCSDAKQIKKENKKKQQEQELKQKQTYSEPRNIKTSSFLPTKGGDEKYYGNNAEPKAPATDDPAEGVDVDDNLCNWGIEHHTCSRAERHERAERARSVINAVLWKQSTIRQSAQSDPVVHADTITTKLARTSIKASQVARIQAVERATKVEFHCSRIIDRRHSEGNAKYGARILDGLSDSEDEGEGGTMGAGKVEDKTLDETVGKRRLPGYRRRASLA